MLGQDGFTEWRPDRWTPARLLLPSVLLLTSAACGSNTVAPTDLPDVGSPANGTDGGDGSAGLPDVGSPANGTCGGDGSADTGPEPTRFDTWKPMSQVNAPAGGAGYTAVWTGTEMIVWGGDESIGRRYAPATDSWEAHVGLWGSGP